MSEAARAGRRRGGWGAGGTRLGAPARGALTLALAAALLGGCATPVERGLPALDLPATALPPEPDLSTWWRRFDDPELSALVDEALAGNDDVRLAAARVSEANAAVRLARTAAYPAVDLAASTGRSRISAQTQSVPEGVPLTTSSWRVAIEASYEVDLWGRIRTGIDAASQDEIATRFAREATRASVAAAAARAYLSLRAIDAEIETLERTRLGYEESLRLVQRRLDRGVAGLLDVEQARAALEGVSARLPPAHAARARLEAQLAALVGRSPRAVYEPAIARSRSLDALAGAVPVPPGLHSAMLERRPDVREAEARIEASRLRVDQARAQYYPQITLTAALGLESADFSDFFSLPARFGRIAGGLLQPIVGVKRIDAEVELARVRAEQALLVYEGTVRAAFRDVREALAGYRGALAQQEALERQRAALAESVRLSKRRYEAGLSSYLEVLVSERALLEAEQLLVASARDRLLALTDLYLALGGGW